MLEILQLGLDKTSNQDIADKISKIDQQINWELSKDAITRWEKDYKTVWNTAWLEEIVRDYIGKPIGEIYRSDLDAITYISISWLFGIEIGYVYTAEDEPIFRITVSLPRVYRGIYIIMK